MANEDDLIPIGKVYETFEEFGLEMSDEVRDFFEYLVYRQSDSITHMNYKKFFEIFEDGYLLDESPYEGDVDLGELAEDSRDSLR